MHEQELFQDAPEMETAAAHTAAVEKEERGVPFVATELDACRMQVKEWQNKFFYLSADFENYKKRVAADRAVHAQSVQTDLIRSLLPVIDGIERSLAVSSDVNSCQGLTAGVRMVHQEFQTLLRNLGVEEIVVTGQFHPETHEALSHVADSGYVSGHIVQVFQKGYQLKGMLLRPALVSVAQ
jgi:molecular chaperone GrpE